MQICFMLDRSNIKGTMSCYGNKQLPLFDPSSCETVIQYDNRAVSFDSSVELAGQRYLGTPTDASSRILSFLVDRRAERIRGC
jgi:hypothetical protein